MLQHGVVCVIIPRLIKHSDACETDWQSCRQRVWSLAGCPVTPPILGEDQDEDQYEKQNEDQDQDENLNEKQDEELDENQV